MTIEMADFLGAACEYNQQEFEIRTDYVGRGMSKPTVGIVVANPMQLFADTIWYCADAADEAEVPATKESLRVDNMGKQYIIY